MTPNPAKILPIYRANLARYEAAGDADRVRVQKSLIARLERDLRTLQEKRGKA